MFFVAHRNKCKKAKVNCKIVDQNALEQTAENAASPHSSILVLAVVLFTSLHLITCKYSPIAYGAVKNLQ